MRPNHYKPNVIIICLTFITNTRPWRVLYYIKQKKATFYCFFNQILINYLSIYISNTYKPYKNFMKFKIILLYNPISNAMLPLYNRIPTLFRKVPYLMQLLLNSLLRLRKDLHQIRYALLIILVYCLFTQLTFHTVCPFAILTGMACPACGLTRAGILLLCGQFVAAADANFMIYFWVPYFIYLVVFRYLLERRPPFMFFLCSVLCSATILYYFERICTHKVVSVPTVGILSLVY